MIRDGQNSCCTCHNTKGWNTSACFVNKLETNCSQFIPLYLLCTLILISVVLLGEDALKIAVGKTKSTNLRPGTQKTFGRKNTAHAYHLPPSGVFSFVKEKKGSEMQKRTKEEEIEKGGRRSGKGAEKIVKERAEQSDLNMQRWRLA